MDKYFKRNLHTLGTILAPLEKEWREWEKNGQLNWYDKHLAINTAAYLRYLMAKATAVQFAEFRNERVLEATFGDDYKQDNTYNYDEPYTRDMVVVKKNPSPNDEDKAYTIGFAPHYGGDVRGNYGDYIILTFRDFYEFAEAHDEFVGEQTATLEIDGTEYQLHWSGAGEDFVLENDEGFYNDGVYIGETEKDDIIKELKERYL